MVDFMYLILCITFHHTSGEFQEHIDLQKISEVMFRNEKFNVLKPTVHVIRDHFKDFIQKRNSVNFPTDRVFLDKNGFRHFWGGMEIPGPKNLRKADLSEKANVLNTDKETILKPNNKQISTVTNINKNTTVKIKDKPRRKKKIEADTFIPAKQTLRGASTVVKTTFFCPFFGVITMSTNVDNFDEFHHTSGEFQEHIDLQKISEVMFRNEKFNVLKPTVHVIRDHFKDYIQKRNSVNFPTDRVFLDKNGFRHFWGGMEIPGPKNLRKADLSEKANVLNTDKETILKPNNKQISTVTNINKNTTVKIKDKPRRKKKIEADTFIPAKQTLRGASTVVKTTFFCPFFGVITMSTNVDNFDEVIA